MTTLDERAQRGAEIRARFGGRYTQQWLGSRIAGDGA